MFRYRFSKININQERNSLLVLLRYISLCELDYSDTRLWLIKNNSHLQK
jgi:hypothetical protein